MSNMKLEGLFNEIYRNTTEIIKVSIQTQSTNVGYIFPLILTAKQKCF